MYCTDENTARQKRKHILLFSAVIVLICSGIYLLLSFIRYPQIRLDQAALYGDQQQNLKDFEITGRGIRSTSSDPWIEYHLDQPVRIKAIELGISGVTETEVWGEIFDTDTWDSAVYPVRNGSISVLFHDRKASETSSLRFDLADSSSVYLEIEQIVINSRYRLFCGILKYLLLASMYLLLYEISCFMLYDFIKDRPEASRSKRKEVAVWVCALIPAVLMGSLLYRLLFHPVRDSQLLWMYLLMILGLLMLLLQLKYSEKENLSLEYARIFLSALFSVGILEVLSGIEYNFGNPWALVLNILLAAFPIFLLYGVFGRVTWAILISHFFLLLLAVTNHYFFQFRGNPFELSDLRMAGTALTVLGNYEFQIDQELFFCLLSETGIAGCLLLSDHTTPKRRIMLRSLAPVCLIILVSTICSPDTDYWNMAANTQQYGYISSFVAYAKHDMVRRKPDGYSREAVLNVLEKYEYARQDPITAEYPNILVIMNEAFADLPGTYGFATQEDGMPFIHSLSENTIKGTILASVFGGSTANTEYEFLTGNTMAFLSEGNVPYMQFVKSQQESLVHELNALGYQTIAFHPYPGGNYNRDKVYPLLGFEIFVTEADELLYTEHTRAYMSDQADFLNLIDIYEKRDKNRPFYLFNVTMQNHGGYSRYKSEVDVTVNPESEELQSAQLLEYLSLIKATDTAFRTLVEYFEKEDAKTIILMFGDHQPGLDEEIYNRMMQVGDPALSETSELPYMVPFVLWANYDMKQEDGVLTSPGYLRPLLLESARLPLGSYDRFLSDCRKEYPAINRMGYYDAAGGFHSAEDGLKAYGILWEYQLLQYANMFDKDLWKNSFIFPQVMVY